MKIAAIEINNFRAIRHLPRIRLREIPTIIGKNDAGKSCILHAINVFFEKQKLERDDLNRLSDDDEVIITISFDGVPDIIKLDTDIEINLVEENLFDQPPDGRFLTIQKTYSLRYKTPKVQFDLIVYDYDHDDFKNLCSRKEKELNELGAKYGLDFKKAGRSITNKDKRAQLRRKAEGLGIPKGTLKITPSDELYRHLSELLPDYVLFKADTSLSIEETAFQNEFQIIIDEALEQAKDVKENLEGKISTRLENEFSVILQKLMQHTNAITSLKPVPEFQWKKLVKFDLECTDQAGLMVPLSKRGAGIKRLLMVAFFQYLAERTLTEDTPARYVFAIEEPETFLYPPAKRELCRSLIEIARRGIQIIMTTHSPLFAGQVPFENLILLTSEGGTPRAHEYPNFDFDIIIEELGVLPSDGLLPYNSCVFVEGQDDVSFLHQVCNIYKQAGRIPCTFEEKKILVTIFGGTNLSFYVQSRMFKKLSRRYSLMIDGDVKPAQREKLSQICEEDGGLLHCLKKREIENYLHPAVFKREFDVDVVVSDFDDEKSKLGRFLRGTEPLIGLFKKMTYGEFAERAKYIDPITCEEKDELLELLNKFLLLTG